MHLAVAISSHGFGHGAQTAAVLTALRARLPGLRLTLLTGLPRRFLEQRVPGDFELIDWRGDFGMHMRSALEVDLERSAAAYAAFHGEWEIRLADAAALMGRLAPDLLLVNIPYLALAAAARAGVPAVALCSFNWALVYRHYFGQRPEAGAILGSMQAAYAGAESFLCPEPALPMPGLDNLRPLGPLARLGRDGREALRDRLGLRGDQRVVVVSPGGLSLSLRVADWPVDPGLVWIVPAAWDAERPDMHSIESLGMAFPDLLASADALLGKLGYGTVTECACNGVPLLYMPRADWPEEVVLAAWLGTHGRCAPVGLEVVGSGGLRPALDGLWSQSAPPRPAPSGADQAADLLAERLRRAAGYPHR